MNKEKLETFAQLATWLKTRNLTLSVSCSSRTYRFSVKRGGKLLLKKAVTTRGMLGGSDFQAALDSLIGEVNTVLYGSENGA